MQVELLDEILLGALHLSIFRVYILIESILGLENWAGRGNPGRSTGSKLGKNFTTRISRLLA